MATNATGQQSLDAQRYELLQSWQERFPDQKTTGARYYIRLAEQVSRDALAFVRSAEHDPAKHGTLDAILWRSFEMIDFIISALDSTAYDEASDPKQWHHARHPVRDLMNGNAPEMSNDLVEGVVAQYLDLPFRSERMDRLLVDMLVAMEMYAFGRERLGEVKRGTLLGWLKNRFYNALFWTGVFVAAHFFAGFGWISRGSADGTGTVVFWIYVAESAWTLFFLFRRTKSQRLIGAMQNVYIELGSSGPFSARQIERRLEATNAEGVVWPAPLYALLDDINNRGGRF